MEDIFATTFTEKTTIANAFELPLQTGDAQGRTQIDRTHLCA